LVHAVFTVFQYSVLTSLGCGNSGNGIECNARAGKLRGYGGESFSLYWEPTKLNR